MKRNGFKINTIKLALCLAYPALTLPVLAAEPWPALPPALSTAVTPNVLLHVDNSGSMNSYPPSGGADRKIVIARDVAKDLISNNQSLRWGLFSFDPNSNETAGVLQAPVGSTKATLDTAINALGPDTWTPLGETLFEMSRYWAGETSYFGKTKNAPGGQYTSPIQYRCQKNFNIVITDGVSTKDNKIPGLPGFAGVNYRSYDTNGGALTKTFKACQDANTVSSVTCPAVLEGSVQAAGVGSNKFVGTVDDGASYGRSIRDVAMFSFDKDMRVGGNDLDGKSFDDPKFPKQNVITYTVGFAVDDPVLKASATVGGGAYYTAGNRSQLSSALNTVVASIIASISNAGGVATTNPYKVAGNKVFQPVFNPNGWYGELRCYDFASMTFDSSGNIVSGQCTPNAKSLVPAAASRKIWSSTWAPATGQVGAGAAVSGTGAFEFLDTATTLMTAAQLADLGSTAIDQKNAINFVRGIDGSNRARSNGLLGDITDAQPVVVAAPSGATSDASYAAFQTTNAARNVVFIGSNDGMMHAFNVADMTELMGYVPAAVYPHLAALPSITYGASGGTAHVYGANGEARQADLKLGASPTWKTVVVGGLAQGGQGFYALDATDSATLTAAANNAFKWEWNDQHDTDMGYTFGAPLIYNVRTSASTVVPAVILVNGYENDYDDTAVGGKRKAENTAECTRTVSGVTKPCNTSALYIVNADNGKLIKKIAIPGNSTGIGGLSSPAGVDFGQDGILDYVYAGDMNGKLWRFDLTSDDPNNFKVAANPIFDAGSSQPITLRPAIKPVSDASGNSRGNLVLFGTGKLLLDSDRSTTTTQSFYGVLDDMSATPITVSKASLVQRVVNDAVNVSVAATGYRSGTYRKVEPLASGVRLDLTLSTETKKGWYIDLPASSERLVSSPVLLDYLLMFGTGIPLAAEKCMPGGAGWVMGVDPLTGGVTVNKTKKPYSFIDIKVDGKSTVDDQLSFSSGDAYASGLSTDAIPTELTYVSDSSKLITISSSGTSTYGDAGSVIALKEANLMAIYTGNAAAGTTKGNPMGRPADGGSGGKLIKCKLGTPGCSQDDINKAPGTGVKLETTLWREIK